MIRQQTFQPAPVDLLSSRPGIGPVGDVGQRSDPLPLHLLDRQAASTSHLLDGLADTAALIALEQCPSGGFISSEIDLLRGTFRGYEEVFATGLIASMLAEFPHLPVAGDIVDKATRWLAAQRGADLLWAFHGPAGRFPPDIDDTAVGLATMLKGGGAGRAEVDLLHAYFSRGENGLFGTWRTDIGRTQTFDATANAHLLLFLAAAGAPVEPLEARLLQHCTERDAHEASPYYTSRLPLLVAICQYLSGKSGTETQVADSLSRIAHLLAILFRREHGFGESDAAPLAARLTTSADLSLYRRRSRQVFYDCRPLRLAYLYWFLAARISLIDNS